MTTDERSIQTISAPANGVVEKLFVRAPQLWVKKGEPLAQLWIPQWTTAQQDFLAVRQLGDGALTRAARDRLALQFMPEATILAVERSGKPQTRLTLARRSRGLCRETGFTGRGAGAQAQTLFELASLDPVWLVVDYPQSQAQTLSAGQRDHRALLKLAG